MDKNIKDIKPLSFEDIKQIDEDGTEFWYARALAKILEYSDFRNFLKVIEKAKKACINSNYKLSDHIVEVNEMVDLGSGSSREIKSFKLSRYACYLIVQNVDPSKPIVANGQTYFAIQTRRQKLKDGYFVSKHEDTILDYLTQINDDDKQNGYIYILESKSHDDRITTKKDLYKIGFSTTAVEQQIKNAKNDPTYLMADVKIEEAINLIINGKIINYQYDSNSGNIIDNINIKKDKL